MESFEEFLSKYETPVIAQKTEGLLKEASARDKSQDKSISNSNYTQTITESVSHAVAETPVFESYVPMINEEPAAGYKLYRDKTETFICDMEISGANPGNSKARVIIESRDMTYMFEGTIDGNGHCEIPLKKMNFLAENEVGKIKLEVIADDMMFNPWEETFVAVNHRKVTVRVAESVDNTPKVGVKISNIR
jgi:hypothetical protein